MSSGIDNLLPAPKCVKCSMQKIEINFHPTNSFATLYTLERLFNSLNLDCLDASKELWEMIVRKQQKKKPKPYENSLKIFYSRDRLDAKIIHSTAVKFWRCVWADTIARHHLQWLSPGIIRESLLPIIN